jgi:hypothetical protein
LIIKFDQKIVNIGKYIAGRIEPTISPTTTIIVGSSIEVSLQMFPAIRTCPIDSILEDIFAAIQLIGIWDCPSQEQFQLKPLSGAVFGIRTRLSQGLLIRTRCGLPQLVGGELFPTTCSYSNP